MIPQEPNLPKGRSRDALVIELKRVADLPHVEFAMFWKGMSEAEKGRLLHGDEENQVPVGR